MTERPALSKGEMEIARTLWELKHGTVREVFDAFPKARGIDFTTVQTYLRRLEKKGYVNVKLDGRTRVYSPRVKPRTVIRETVDDLVDRLFAGETFPLMQHLIEDRNVSRQDLDALKALLEQLTEERDASD
ncbi:BlaI/MecI/CopY family transcriptional regulator [uncultured Gimesia sp.]|jgi:BlaI family transcriptional regulator, penicillinase repressor|uniref:BlaI/MecI/CopY family transcriptional regulator n=1 Tax=uncultured Gimesia sp. TaxID=1678688 RepID=UPI002603CED8|nr:BlaI/MecI/CopY family transcriptional regulator [uncultured Gimesia sp.]